MYKTTETIVDANGATIKRGDMVITNYGNKVAFICYLWRTDDKDDQYVVSKNGKFFLSEEVTAISKETITIGNNKYLKADIERALENVRSV